MEGVKTGKPSAIPDSPYDLETYSGRVKHSAALSSPFNLLHSNADIKAKLALVRACQNGEVAVSPEFWAAKRVVDSAVHPDTGEIVMFPFRMSSYVLSNLVVTLGMLTPGLGTAGTLFWQIANQSLNVAVNTANANKTKPLSTRQLVTSYFMAVTGSCSVALGLNALLPRLKKISPTTRAILGRLVPFAAVVSAGLLNVFLMRAEEIRKGITVFDAETNEPLGESRKAAIRAVSETALSRAVTATPVMVLPPLILYRLQQGVLKKSSAKVVAAANLGIITLTSFAILPFALGIFPSKRYVDGSRLEPSYSGRKVWFNRGL